MCLANLLNPLRAEMRDDTAYMDRLHGYAAVWNFPKVHRNEHLTNSLAAPDV
jgi:ATP-dependent Lon protease